MRALVNDLITDKKSAANQKQLTDEITGRIGENQVN